MHTANQRLNRLMWRKRLVSDRCSYAREHKGWICKSGEWRQEDRCDWGSGDDVYVQTFVWINSDAVSNYLWGKITANGIFFLLFVNGRSINAGHISQWVVMLYIFAKSCLQSFFFLKSALLNFCTFWCVFFSAPKLWNRLFSDLMWENTSCVYFIKTSSKNKSSLPL